MNQLKETKILLNNCKRYYNSVTVYPRAIKYHRIPTSDPRISNRIISKRSTIKIFSRHSRLRLREAIAKNTIPYSICFGVTLTLPWHASNNKHIQIIKEFDIHERYKKCFNRFTTYFRRTFQNSGCIFRHELQSRKIPHCHLILYLSKYDLNCSEEAVKSQILPLWWSALNGDFGSGDKIGFFKYGVHVEKLVDNLALFRYLADHTSKSKQHQLGYIGKHWGFIRRECFQPIDGKRIDFTDQKARVFFSRHVSKVCRFSISWETYQKRKNKKSRSDHFSRFGSIKVKRNDVSGFRFVSWSTVSPLIRYMRKYQMILD